MTQRKKVITINKFIDWWIVEGYFLLLILASTFNLLRTTASDLPPGNPFSWNLISILALMGVAFSIALALLVNEKNEKRAFILISIAFVILQITAFFEDFDVMIFSYLSWLVFSVFGYYYLRKAGQYRRLNIIKTPFAVKGRKALLSNVIFLESIALILGLIFYVAWRYILIPRGL